MGGRGGGAWGGWLLRMAAAAGTPSGGHSPSEVLLRACSPGPFSAAAGCCPRALLCCSCCCWLAPGHSPARLRCCWALLPQGACDRGGGQLYRLDAPNGGAGRPQVTAAHAVAGGVLLLLCGRGWDVDGCWTLGGLVGQWGLWRARHMFGQGVEGLLLQQCCLLRRRYTTVCPPKHTGLTCCPLAAPPSSPTIHLSRDPTPPTPLVLLQRRPPGPRVPRRPPPHRQAVLHERCGPAVRA